MIRYGPAGIPLSCKGRTLKDGIEDVHSLALTALEIQMVRPRYDPRPPEDEEIGKTIRELDAESEFIVGIEREDADDIIYDPDVPIDEEDNLLWMSAGPAACFADLYKLGNVARRHDVSLSIHTPYYMDLTADITDMDDPRAGLTMQYYESVRQAGFILNALGGDIVVTNIGPYSDDRSREETDDIVRNNLGMLTEWWQDMKFTPRLGIEVTGHQDVFGSLDQVLDLCDEIPGLTPVMNFAHYQSRTKGSLLTATDFADILQKLEPYSDGRIYSSFSNVEYDAETGNEKWLTPVKKGDLKFERLAEALAEIKPNITIISSSPLLEHDAVYMRTLTERVLSKKAAKIIKERKRAEEQAAKDAAAESAEGPAADEPSSEE
ncbi:Endonuclease IV [Thermoplasmatales archaeon BRNA1]|nr:Endonuclease IV [Thermoplasmatales archaeon BRNA1]